LSGAIFPPGASLAVVYHPTNKAIDVFGVDNDGVLKDVRREKLTFGTPFWQPPVPLTGPGFAEPGAPVTAVWQPLNDQLEVYVVGTNGAVVGVWNENNGPWKPAFNLTDAGFAPRFTEIAAAWAPSSEMLEVFVADNSGSLKGIWKLHDRAWGTPESITGSGFMSAGGPVAAVWEPSNNTLDVFTLDQNGTAKVTSKHHTGAVPLPAMPWGPPRALFDNVPLQRNSLLTATWSEVRDAPVVSVVDSTGAVRETYTFRGNWLGAYEPMTNAGFAPAGASLASTSLPIRTIDGYLGDNPNNLKSVAVFGVDPSKAIRQVTVDKAGTPLTRPNYNPIYGSHAAYCSNVLRHYSSVTSESSYKDCVDFMGLTKYCADQGAHVMPDYRGNKAILNCQLDYHQDSWLWQYGEEARWIANAAHDAFVAVVPMLELAGETTGCAAGVIFACVALAVDVAGHVDQLAGGADVADSVLSVKDCAEDDILACAKLGQKGIDAAAGVTIPGEDPASVDGDAARCRNGEFQACMRLGEQAAGAGGMPFDSQSRREADACSNGDFNACISLGKHAADLGVPLGGVPNAADNLNNCKSGDLPSCGQLGQALASVPR